MENKPDLVEIIHSLFEMSEDGKTVLYKAKDFVPRRLFDSEHDFLSWIRYRSGRRAPARVDMFGHNIQLQKLAWAIHHGKFPDHNVIVRLDGDFSKKSLAAPVSRSRPLPSKSPRKNNTSSVAGVWFCKKSCGWRAEITVGYTKIGLGVFDNFELAAAAREGGARAAFALGVFVRK